MFTSKREIFLRLSLMSKIKINVPHKKIMLSLDYSTVKKKRDEKKEKKIGCLEFDLIEQFLSQHATTTCVTLIFSFLRPICFQFLVIPVMSYPSLHLTISLTESKVLQIKSWSFAITKARKGKLYLTMYIDCYQLMALHLSTNWNWNWTNWKISFFTSAGNFCATLIVAITILNHCLMTTWHDSNLLHYPTRSFKSFKRFKRSSNYWIPW